jgi:hypothetical protein
MNDRLSKWTAAGWLVLLVNTAYLAALPTPTAANQTVTVVEGKGIVAREGPAR